MMGRRRRIPSKLRSPLALGLALAMTLGPGFGCGEDPSRLAGTLDMPERKPPSRPDFKAIAKEAKQARAKGKARAAD